jgi:hypothetical protein
MVSRQPSARRFLSAFLWVSVTTILVAVWMSGALFTALEFVTAYQPSGTYTGQDWDRSAAWVLLGVLAVWTGAIALWLKLTQRPARRRPAGAPRPRR